VYIVYSHLILNSQYTHACRISFYGLEYAETESGVLFTGAKQGGGGALHSIFMLLGKPIVILSDIFSGTQPSNRQHGCWRRRFQPWMADEAPVTEAATNLGNRKKYHLVSLGEAEQHENTV